MEENNFNFNNKTSEDLKNKRIFIAGVIVFAIIVLSIIIIFIVSKSREQHHTGESLPEYATSYENRYLLRSKLDSNPAIEVTSHIDQIITNQGEIDSAPQENNSTTSNYNTLTITISEDSFKTTDDGKDYTSTFDLSVSDGRKYSIIVFEDGSFGRFYLGTIIKRTDRETKDYVFFDYNEGAEYYGQDLDYKELLENWLKTQSVKNPEIDYSSLIIEEK